MGTPALIIIENCRAKITISLADIRLKKDRLIPFFILATSKLTRVKPLSFNNESAS